MPTTVSYPGVYIEEVPSGVRTIVGVATSITAFVGTAKQGPTHDPIPIKSFAAFKDQFGGLQSDSMMSYAVSHFFGNGGTDALVVRIAPQDAKATIIKLPAPNGEFLALEAKGEGVWGNNLRAAIETGANTKDPSDAKLFNLRIVLLEDDGSVDKSEVFRNVSVDPGSPQFIENVLEDLSSLVRVKRGTGTPQAAPNNASANAEKEWMDGFDGTFYEQGKGGKDAVVSPASPGAKARIVLRTQRTDRWHFQAKTEGVAGNQVRVRVVKSPTKPDAFQLQVWERKDDDNNGQADEVPLSGRKTVDVGLSEVQNLQQLKDAIDASDVAALIEATVPDSGADQIATPSVLPRFHDEPSDKWIESGDGTDGVAGLKASDYTRDGIDDNGEKKGLFALEKADLFNLLCIPPASRGEKTENSVYQAALNLCHKERAFLLVDSPPGWDTVKQAVDNFGGLRGELGSRTKNGAIFFPHLKMADPLRDNNTAVFPPSGAIAGVISTIDASRGVWKAPAGIEAALGGVREFTVKINDADNGQLNPIGVNCLRNFPVYGNIVWGSRTLDGNDQLTSESKYLAIRRFTLFLEESLYRGTQWVVFEPNDEPLWAQIRQNVGAFMQGLFRKGAFQGQTARDAYFVNCDSNTNPQILINQGIVTIEVGFAPLKPAEFVIIKIQQIPGDIDT